MPLFAKVEAETPHLEPNWYAAAVRAVSKNSHPQYGDSWKFEFEVVGGEHAGAKITGMTDLKIVPGRKTALWLAAMGIDIETPGTKIDLEETVGRKVRILVDEKANKQGTGSYAVVSKVMPLKKAEPAPVADEGDKEAPPPPPRPKARPAPAPVADDDDELPPAPAPKKRPVAPPPPPADEEEEAPAAEEEEAPAPPPRRAAAPVSKPAAKPAPVAAEGDSEDEEFPF